MNKQQLTTTNKQYNNSIFIGTQAETMLIQGGFNWNTAVINTNNYELTDLFLKTSPGRLIFSNNFKNSIKKQEYVN